MNGQTGGIGMKKRCYCFAGFWAIFLTAQLLFGQAHFTGKFSPAQQSHDVTATATGTATCFLTDEGLWFYITVEGLTGEIAAAHFHNGAIGTDGSVVRTITDEFTGNTATGLWTSSDSEPLTDELVEALFAGNLYFNVHTAANQAGEIRAQINHSAGTGLQANLTAAQETHDVTSTASGTASLVLTDAGVAFKITVDGLSGPIAAAHFHNGPAGQDGSVVRTITDDFDGNTAIGLWTADDEEALTDDLVAELLAGNLYLNIHTAANQPGEIRGQVHLNSGWALTANLDASQETHAVTSDAKGTAALTLTDAGLVFKVTVDGLSGPIAAAHFHNAAAGTDGSVVRTISADFDGTTATGLWTANDTEPLTSELIQELLSGNLYLNVHTAANQPGEIRGQVTLSNSTHFSARLTAAQESHDVTSSANGTAFVTLTSEGAAFSITVDSLSGPIAAAHFHNGAMGTDGTVVRTISADFTGNTATGVWTSSDSEPLTDELIGELLAGNLYFNVHTAANQAGEIRGQVILTGGTDLAARLTAAQETHDVTSDAKGTAAVILTDAGVQFHLTVNGLSGAIAAAHFHNGAAGADGSVVRTITDDLNGNTASGLWTANDREPLTDELKNALLAGNLYLNVHTAANQPGEIRGQVIINSGVGITSRLDAAQESNNVTSDAMGTSALTLTNEGLVFDVTVEGLSGEIAAAHFHNGPVGQNGSVVRTISGDLAGSNTGFGVWRSSDTEPLTVDLTNAILGGDIYFNFHTAANQAGEIRGQVNPQEVITSVQLVDDTRVPAAFDLAQNYPNPFNPETSITYLLASAGKVRITIYNLLGQKIRDLVDATQQAGTYRALWDGRNDRGISVPSGVYIYRMHTADFLAVKKMTLLR
jgi:Cu/Zn superoxide dismutase